MRRIDARTRFHCPNGFIMKRFWFFFLICGIVTGCHEDPKPVEKPKPSPQSVSPHEDAIQEGLNQVQEILNGTQDTSKTIVPLSLGTLKSLFPDKVTSFSRSKLGGQQTDVIGFKTTTADATYGDALQSIHLSITDTGNMKRMVGMAFSWASMDFEEQTETGTKQTTQLDGHPAFEQSETAPQSAELAILVGGRYVITAKGNKVSLDQLRTVVRNLPLQKLSDWKGKQGP